MANLSHFDGARVPPPPTGGKDGKENQLNPTGGKDGKENQLNPILFKKIAEIRGSALPAATQVEAGTAPLSLPEKIAAFVSGILPKND